MIASQTAFAQNNRKGRWCAMELDSIYCGDACQILQSWPAECIDLVFADPPFNIGYLYEGYHDDLPDEQYIEWTFRWMQAARRVLKPTGSIYVAIGDDFAADVRIIGRRLGLHLRNWIIWHYSFGQNMRTKFCRSHTHILYFTKHSRQFTFNAAALRYPGARHTEYQDLRASPTGRLPDDVWSEFPRVCGTFRERARIHGCQMPESLLMRIILASSNPGEVVLDPFVGSGTTVVAAKRLGRRYLGIDISPAYVRYAQQRLAGVRNETLEPARPGNWPALHADLLAQLYRETGVCLLNLLPNEAALRVIAAALQARCGAGYEVAEIRQQLQRMAAAKQLSRLPNDTLFVPRNHVKKRGKIYRRRILRWRGRRSIRTGELALLRVR